MLAKNFFLGVSRLHNGLSKINTLQSTFEKNKFGRAKAPTTIHSIIIANERELQRFRGGMVGKLRAEQKKRISLIFDSFDLNRRRKKSANGREL